MPPLGLFSLGHSEVVFVNTSQHVRALDGRDLPSQHSSLAASPWCPFAWDLPVVCTWVMCRALPLRCQGPPGSCSEWRLPWASASRGLLSVSTAVDWRGGAGCSPVCLCFCPQTDHAPAASAFSVCCMPQSVRLPTPAESALPSHCHLPFCSPVGLRENAIVCSVVGGIGASREALAPGAQ